MDAWDQQRDIEAEGQRALRDEPMCPVPTDAERAATWKAINALHPANRFRLMFGQPLLDENGNPEPLK